MVTVALAGATTGFGLTMLRVFHHLNSDATNPHKLVLLSRSVQPAWTAKGVDVRPVDYANHAQLTRALKDVHTILSVIGGNADAIRKSQLALLAAAKEAGVKRFAPSEYAGISNEGIDLYAGKAEVWSACQAVASETGMEVTTFQCGLFMSIFATGTPKPLTPIGLREGAITGEEEALAGLRPWSFVLNMKAGTADLPAAFVYHALSLPRWPEVLGMRGDVKSFREMIAIVERVQGRRILMKDNTVAEMRAQVEEDPGKAFYNQVRIALTDKWAMVPDSLNQEFSDLEPTTCEEFVEKWWRGVEVGEPSWGEDKSFM
ncbi:hypothetical protein LTR86_006283 [Recurvomyces mirabilis]|nr:hypothetical protein LTR86_006283 [Recurvomyces mirabilis]